MRGFVHIENVDSIIAKLAWLGIDIAKEKDRINVYGEITLNR